MGSTGFVGTICYLFLSHKIAYLYVEITSVSYYLTSTAALLLIIGYLVYFQINKYSNITKAVRNEKGSNIRILGPSAGALSGLGYIFAQATKESELLMFSILLVISLGFCLFFAYISAKFFHKYFFMKANQQFVGLQQPYKSKQREFEKKGVVIK